MKHAGAKALAFAEKPPAKPRAALLFGADTGLVAAAADQLSEAWLPKGSDPLNLVKLTEDDLKLDATLLIDELLARSLMGGERLVRVRIERETSAKPIIEALGEIEAGTLVPEAAFIVEAGNLGPASKLRAAFEGASKAAALDLSADDEALSPECYSKGWLWRASPSSRRLWPLSSPSCPASAGLPHRSARSLSSMPSTSAAR
jgi:DNA polymerase-3 subunit delta